MIPAKYRLYQLFFLFESKPSESYDTVVNDASSLDQITNGNIALHKTLHKQFKTDRNMNSHTQTDYYTKRTNIKLIIETKHKADHNKI